jgi:hypothetical protein
MPEPMRLKIKVGPHEFEAEGPTDVVQNQFRSFKDLLISLPQPPAQVTQSPSQADEFPVPPPPTRQDLATTDSALPKIMKEDGRVISLTARPRSIEDAVLLLLYGHKTLRDNDSVTGGDVIDGLTATGGLAVGRVDRLLEKAGKDGDVIVVGERRRKRYRLTNQGLAKARQIATDLIAIVA